MLVSALQHHIGYPVPRFVEARTGRIALKMVERGPLRFLTGACQHYFKGSNED